MNEKYAQLLSGELVSQFSQLDIDEINSLDIDKDYLSRTLTQNKIRQRSKLERFSVELDENEQIIETSNTKYHLLSLMRVLRNEDAKRHSLTTSSKFFEYANSKLGFSNSSRLTRDLRLKNQHLVELMELHSIECPFSLLANFRTYDYSNCDEPMKISNRPILIIPHLSQRADVGLWEDKNTKYFTERPFFFDKKISKLFYQSI